MTSSLKASNQLLAALPPEEFELIRPDLVDLDLPVGHVLFNPGEIFRDVYFPTTAVISMQIVMKDGKPVEVTTVGHEGLFGGVRLFFDDDEAFARAICDVSGHVQKIASDVFWALVKALPGLRHVVHHYTHAAFMETAVRLTHCPNALLADETGSRTHPDVAHDRGPGRGDAEHFATGRQRQWKRISHESRRELWRTGHGGASADVRR
jgi:CRP-like cAMP-binding protein